MPLEEGVVIEEKRRGNILRQGGKSSSYMWGEGWVRIPYTFLPSKRRGGEGFALVWENLEVRDPLLRVVAVSSFEQKLTWEKRRGKGAWMASRNGGLSEWAGVPDRVCRRSCTNSSRLRGEKSLESKPGRKGGRADVVRKGGGFSRVGGMAAVLARKKENRRQ